MKRHPVPALLVLVLGLLPSACRDAFTTTVTHVAEAGDARLTVDRVAEVFAQGRALAVERPVVQRVARLWVDYNLFAQRWVAGDSLLDSATVVTTLWPEVHQRIAGQFHELLVAGKPVFDTATVDSVYQAGQYRLVQHALFGVEANATAAVREARRKRANEASARLGAGGSWTEVVRQGDDARTRDNAGTLGVIARGDLPAAFDEAAFTLEPGAVSGVVETPYGFHLVRRPTLREQRAAFVAGVGGRLAERADSVYLAGLPDRRHVRVKGDAPALVRAALQDPQQGWESRTVLGTFDGGKFTVADMLRWVNAMSAQVPQQMLGAGDEQVADFVRSLMRNHAMMFEADSAGVRLTALDLEEFREMLRRDLAALRRVTGLDDGKLKDTTASIMERQRLAALYIDKYLELVSTNQAEFVALPPFLAARLRSEGRWKVSSAGVDRAYLRSAELRAVVDSLRPATPPATDSGGVNAQR